MDQDSLVAREEEAGAELVRTLDKRKVRPSVALWLWNEDQSSWWFVVAGGTLEGLDRKAAFQVVHGALASIDFPFGMDRVAVVPMNDPLIANLTMAFSTPTDDVGSMRLQDVVINNVSISSALIYRLSQYVPPKPKRPVKATSRTGGPPKKSKAKRKKKRQNV